MFTPRNNFTSAAKVKLRSHNTILSKNDLLEEVPDLYVTEDFNIPSGSIVLISQCMQNGSTNELILKVEISDSYRKFDLSLKHNLVERFSFQIGEEVFITQDIHVDKTLTLVELSFKGRYISRSEYWRFSDSLVNTSLYMDQILEFQRINACALQLYNEERKVNSGMVSTNTRIVFRSSSAQIFLFFQLSAEMWEFDDVGDIYFERAINKFLKPLFANWKKNDCLHELTIVYFSRTFYKVSSVEELPESIKTQCLQKMDDNLFYQDFYKVITQDDIRKDWSSIIRTLKREFIHYKKSIGLEFINIPDDDSITDITYTNNTNNDDCAFKQYNSHARYGNFLEAINLTLNIFEKHPYDRILDRTGQQFALITPSTGVFENSIELIELTERRMLDFGIGTDIVFLGRQPPHAVPLFIYYASETPDKPKYYVAPHWLNFSYLGESIYMENKENNPGRRDKFELTMKVPDDFINPFKIAKREAELEAMEDTDADITENILNSSQKCNSKNAHDSYIVIGSKPPGWVDIKPQDMDTQEFMRRYDEQVWRPKSEIANIWKIDSHPPQLYTPSTSPNTSLFRPFSNATPQETFSMPCNSINSTLPSSLTFGYKRSKLPNSLPEVDTPISSGSPQEFLFAPGSLHSNDLIDSHIEDSHTSEAPIDDYRHNTSPIDLDQHDTNSANDIPNVTSPVLKVNDKSPSPKKEDKVEREKSEINPFDRNCKLTQSSSSRRRWGHCFPVSNKGIIKRDHYLHNCDSDLEEDITEPPEPIFQISGVESLLKIISANPKVLSATPDQFGVSSHRISRFTSNDTESTLSTTPSDSVPFRIDNFRNSKLQRSHSAPDTLPTSKVGTDVTEAFYKRGLNWKSLIHPALFPITNDFYPGDATLFSNEYANYQSTHFHFSEVLPEIHYEEHILTAMKEIISQRLVCGFQLITSPRGNVFSVNKLLYHKDTSNYSSTKLWLSLGDVFHEISLDYKPNFFKVFYDVIIYTPINNQKRAAMEYSYNLWPLGCKSFEYAGQIFEEHNLTSQHWDSCDINIWRQQYLETISQDDLYWTIQYILLPNVPPNIELLKTGNKQELNKWCDKQFKSFAKFFNQINFFKQMLVHGDEELRGRSGSYALKNNPVCDNEKIRNRIFNDIKTKNWSDLVIALLNKSSGFKSTFPIASTSKFASHSLFVLCDLVWYLQDILQCKPYDDNIGAWNIIEVLYENGYMYRPDGNLISFSKNGYLIFALRQTPEIETATRHGHISDKLCAFEVIWEFPDTFITAKLKTREPLTNKHYVDDDYVPQIRDSFSKGQRICSLIDCVPHPTCDLTDSIQISHDIAYCPMSCFRLEIQFRVASSSIMNQVSSEFHRISLNSNYQFKPYACCFMLSELFAHPFRRPYFIPLELDHGYVKSRETVVWLMSIIALKFGFIRESYLCNMSSLITPTNEKQLSADNCRFTHYTGAYFVSINYPEDVKLVDSGFNYYDRNSYASNLGYYWWNNYLMNRDCRSQQVDEDTNADLSAFIQYCSGVNGELNRFCQEEFQYYL